MIESAYSIQWFRFHLSLLLISGLTSWDEDAKFFELLKVVGGFVLRGQVVVQNFSIIPYNSVCFAAIQNRSAARSWNSESFEFDQESGSLQSCSLFQDRKILMHRTRKLLSFWKSWMWVNNWLTVVGFLRCCKDNSSHLACLVCTFSSKHVLLNSAISWQYLAWFSWKSPFLNSNSPYQLIFSLWTWSAHRLAWCSWNRWDSNSWLISCKEWFRFGFSQLFASVWYNFCWTSSLPEWPTLDHFSLSTELRKKGCNRFSVQFYLISWWLERLDTWPTAVSRKLVWPSKNETLLAVRLTAAAQCFGVRHTSCTAGNHGGNIGCCRRCLSDCAPDPCNWRSRRAWAHNLCLERIRPSGQTPSSKRVRQGIDTNCLCGPEVTLEPWMRKHWVKRGATRLESTWRWATTSKTQDENARAGWPWMMRTQLYLWPRVTECAVCAHEKVCSGTLQEVYSVNILLLRSLHLLPTRLPSHRTSDEFIERPHLLLFFLRTVRCGVLDFQSASFVLEQCVSFLLSTNRTIPSLSTCAVVEPIIPLKRDTRKMSIQLSWTFAEPQGIQNTVHPVRSLIDMHSHRAVPKNVGGIFSAKVPISWAEVRRVFIHDI